MSFKAGGMPLRSKALNHAAEAVPKSRGPLTAG